MEWRRSRGPGPIKTQASFSSPTLIILDLSHLSTVCKYFNTLPPTQLRNSDQGCVLGWSPTATKMLLKTMFCLIDRWIDSYGCIETTRLDLLLVC